MRYTALCAGILSQIVDTVGSRWLRVVIATRVLQIGDGRWRARIGRDGMETVQRRGLAKGGLAYVIHRQNGP
jgi:hypothetical protein